MGIEACNTGLVLGLSLSSTVEKPSKPDHDQIPNKIPSFPKLESTSFDDEPSLTLGLATQKVDVKSTVGGDLYRQASSLSAVSSFSSGKVKRAREISSEELMEVEKKNNSSRLSDEDEEGVRKKLRLSKQQSALLEESFKQHSTLNPKQKQALACELNMKPRQVEVWFQNRRARTKLKQNEADCELLKKSCETLKDENRRLQKEIQELKALKLAQPFQLHMQAPTLAICPSCQTTTGVADANGNSEDPYPISSKPHHFYNNNPLLQHVDHVFC
ncbi:homeobox-leucine zipper protein HAT22-like isoform X2 [Hibiscus syriacus]|uniref:homeobox-leucine zipper protein HAT22-like isoform X2 n=1 Tax=Hibiscus syriacus TaxID=106335 RepID=UPI0019236490|nr:homeobox-leucine zipper protein HAT22-like isoform X2 [Hibiscus syriacus]